MTPHEWIILLAVLGGLDALYTALQQALPGLFEFCFTKDFKRINCKEILHSKYAKLFLVPNSWLGIVTYAMIIVIYSSMQQYIYIAILLVSLGLIISYYLLYVQAFILKKFCIFCLASTTLITIITILAWSS